ncbi:hypothetical protein Q3G72_002978 [Acer saccharum]|nr:hypothetical protein Q3G72_002978 [Acer saccharum]
MEESANKKKSNDNNGRLVVDTSMADKSMWLIKFPLSLSRSRRDGDDPTRPVAKLLLSIDPLSSSNDEFSSPQFTMPMEMIGNESGNAPKIAWRRMENSELKEKADSRPKIARHFSLQDALLEANEVFVSFKQENKKMAKSIKELKKQNCEQLKKQLKESKRRKKNSKRCADHFRQKRNTTPWRSYNSDSVPV